MTPCSKGLRPADAQKHPLQITIRTPEGPDFKFELLPLHSPLLRQSLLVSFPPLIDMLKFSGYSYLIRGQPLIEKDCTAEGTGAPDVQKSNTPGVGFLADAFRAGLSLEKPRAQYQAWLDW